MLLKNAYLCQFKENEFIPIFADVIIDEGKIIKIKSKSYEKFLKFRADSEEPENNTLSEYDANGRVVLPPLVNFHEHIYSRLSKGLPVTGDLSSFIKVLENLWWKLDRALKEKSIKASAQIAAIEAVRNGVGTVFDHHASPSAVSGSLNLIKQELKLRDIKGVLCYEVSDRNGKENMKQGVEENIDFFRFRTSEQFKSQFGLHALFTLSDESLNYIHNEVGDEDIGYHLHVAEGKYDVEFNKKNFSSTLLQRMKKFDLLNKKTFIVHGNHLTSSDLKQLNKYKVNIVHNPDSNFNNAVGTLNLEKVPQGLNLLLGTDGMHCNMLKTYKMAFLNLRHQNRNSTLGFDLLNRIFCNQFSTLKRFFGKSDQLRLADEGNFIVTDYIPYTPLNRENILGHFIYGITESSVRTMYQNEHFLMHDFDIEDEAKILKNAYAAGKEVFQNFEKLDK